ncbi:MAG: transposase [Terrimicrobiaceae bacterium]
MRTHEDEQTLEGLVQESPALNYVRSLPGMGPILAAVVVSEIDGIERFPSAQKLCGYAGLCPSTHSSGGKTFQGKLFRHCNKWLRWAFVEAAWVAIGCSAYFMDFYKRKRALGRKPSLAILATARLMPRITWQLLTQRRAYTSLAKDPIPPKPACRADCLCSGGLGQGSAETAQRSVRFPSKKTFPSRSKIMLVGREAEGFDDAPFNRMEGWGPDS